MEITSHLMQVRAEWILKSLLPIVDYILVITIMNLKILCDQMLQW